MAHGQEEFGARARGLGDPAQKNSLPQAMRLEPRALRTNELQWKQTPGWQLSRLFNHVFINLSITQFGAISISRISITFGARLVPFLRFPGLHVLDFSKSQVRILNCEMRQSFTLCP